MTDKACRIKAQFAILARFPWLLCLTIVAL